MCRECGHRTASPARHEAHLTSPRHIHSFRWQAYQDPRRRAMWLRLWAAEEERARQGEQTALLQDIQEWDELEFIAVKDGVYYYRFPADQGENCKPAVDS